MKKSVSCGDAAMENGNFIGSVGWMQIENQHWRVWDACGGFIASDAFNGMTGGFHQLF